MFKITDIQLELITDIDMFQFIEKGMPSGIIYFFDRFGKANNKHMKHFMSCIWTLIISMVEL